MLPKVVDLHEDISLYYLTGGQGLSFGLAEFNVDLEGRHADIPKYEKANVKLVFGAIFPMMPTLHPRMPETDIKSYQTVVPSYVPRSPTTVALEHIKMYTGLCKRFPKDLRMVETLQDLREVFEGYGVGLVLSLEGAEALADPDDLELLYRLGVRCLQVCWNLDNRYAASCASKRDYGLTGSGLELVALANKLGVVLDISHASKRTALDIIENSKLPVIASHSNAWRVWKNPRNLDDDVLDALRRNGGVVGFTFISPLIAEYASVDALAEHILYVRDSFGPSLMAIGTDYFGLLNMKEPEDLEDITKLPELYEALISRGFKDEDIEMLAHKNAMRVIEANASRWPGSPS